MICCNDSYQWSRSLRSLQEPPCDLVSVGNRRNLATTRDRNTETYNFSLCTFSHQTIYHTKQPSTKNAHTLTFNRHTRQSTTMDLLWLFTAHSGASLIPFRFSSITNFQWGQRTSNYTMLQNYGHHRILPRVLD